VVKSGSFRFSLQHDHGSQTVTSQNID